LITAKMRRTGRSSYSITRDRGAPEVADSGGPPATGRWASPPLERLVHSSHLQRAYKCHTVRPNNTMSTQVTTLIHTSAFSIRIVYPLFTHSTISDPLLPVAFGHQAQIFSLSPFPKCIIIMCLSCHVFFVT